MTEIVLAVGAFAGLVLLVILFRMREKYYTRAGIQAPRFSRGGRKIGAAVGPSGNVGPEGRRGGDGSGGD